MMIRNLSLNLILQTYLLELRLRIKKIAFFGISTIFFAYLTSFYYPYHIDVGAFYRYVLSYFKLFILFVSCFFFSDIICSEFSKKTGYIMFPKINKYKLTIGKLIANLNIILLLVFLYYLALNLSVIIIYDTILVEAYFSLGIAIVYTISISTLILFFSAALPKANYTTITVILLFLIGFPILEQITTAINQEIEPLLSLSYLGNLLNYIIPGGLPSGRRWNWVYYAGDTLPPIKVWLTPTIEMGLTFMIIYTSIFLLFGFLILKRKEL